MNSLRSVQDLWNKYMFILSPSQKRWGVIVAIMTFVGALFEALGVSIILPLVQVIIQPDSLWNNAYFGKVAALLNITTHQQLVWCVCGVVILVYLFKNAFLTFVSYARAKYSCKVQRELSVEMMNSYLGRGYSFFLGVNTGELIRGMTASIYSTYTSWYQVFKLLSELMAVFCICVYIMVMDAAMALCVIFLAVICLLAVVIGFKKWMKICGQKEHKYSAATNKIILQAFHGVKEVLVMSKQKYFVDEYERMYVKRQYAAVGHVVAMESPAFLIEAVCVVGLITAVAVKALGGGDANALVAQLAAFAVGAFRILPSLGRISSSFNQIVFAMPGLNETYHNIREVRRYEESRERLHQAWEASEQQIEFREMLKLKGVTWKYEGGQRNVLENLMLTIKKGQSIAFIGQSGAGKTTLADVILGLLSPQHGAVLLDGTTDIHDVPGQWSQLIGFVPQAVYLTDDTIRNNVGFGIAPSQIEDEKIWNALEQAQLREVVEKLPNGLDTLIGERGVRFSGGQRQRVAIARALYCEPDILVLDEATSALDNETEAAVMEAIDSLQGKMTLIIIAHRLTTVQNCDVIYEIKDGQAIAVDKSRLYG